jgi:hypothetical protein
MQTTCPVCQSSFTNTARPKTYCSVDCQSKAANARTNARRRLTEAVKTPRPSLTLVHCEDPSTGQPARCPTTVLDAEWLECWPDLHRAVAGRMNKTKGSESVYREDAAGNDRHPLAHAVMIDGEWIGRVHRKGAVVWASERLGSLEAAKIAVERHLAGLPELVAESLALAA